MDAADVSLVTLAERSPKAVSLSNAKRKPLAFAAGVLLKRKSNVNRIELPILAFKPNGPIIANVEAAMLKGAKASALPVPRPGLPVSLTTDMGPLINPGP